MIVAGRHAECRGRRPAAAREAQTGRRIGEVCRCSPWFAAGCRKWRPSPRLRPHPGLPRRQGQGSRRGAPQSGAVGGQMQMLRRRSLFMRAVPRFPASPASKAQGSRSGRRQWGGPGRRLWIAVFPGGCRQDAARSAHFPWTCRAGPAATPLLRASRAGSPPAAGRGRSCARAKRRNRRRCRHVRRGSGVRRRCCATWPRRPAAWRGRG